jgi:hypothetical protein
MHASLGSGIGDIAQLVECRPCNWVVALMGWMPNCLGNFNEKKLQSITFKIEVHKPI